MLRTIKSLVGRGLRAAYYALPLKVHDRTRLKSFVYKHLGFLIHNTASHQHWLSERSPAEAPALPEATVSAPTIIQFGDGGIQQLADQIRFEHHEKPLASVVIPTFNNVDYTIRCLASIHAHLPNVSFEIIVVDDGSSDDTASIVSAIPNLRFVRNESNCGFLRTANKGALLARGQYVLFLNNDTQVLAGWLDSLIDVFAKVPNAGIAGSKLIYPTGRLQEAGAALRRDGTVDLIGLDDDPNKPEYNFMREVDHCSGASLLIEKDLFSKLGGFDDRFAPAYFEDCDLSMRVRELGKKVIYQPDSVVVHHLSVTTNDATGGKMRQIDINKKKYLDRWQSELNKLDRVRLIAFYLPQFHPIPENDMWWGKGFTEWTNVAKAKPNFEGHYQPHLPTDLGFYDLRVSEVRQDQATLAREYGIYGFCYYYYWFGGKRLLNHPLDEVLRSGQPQFPFCICWANENWTRRWDGREHEILIAQQHTDEDDLAFIKMLTPALSNDRYIRIDGRPLLLVYRLSLLPDPARTSLIWREHCRTAGVGEIYLACVQSFATAYDPADLGFDAAVEFPPHEMEVPAEPPAKMRNPNFAGRFFDYVKTAENFIRPRCPDYTLFRTVMPRWDNTARRQDASFTYLHSEPEHYEKWLGSVVRETRQFKFGDERLTFINAWNEWGEGNHLEPDGKYGHRYLEATNRALNGFGCVHAETSAVVDACDDPIEDRSVATD